MESDERSPRDAQLLQSPIAPPPPRSLAKQHKARGSWLGLARHDWIGSVSIFAVTLSSAVLVGFGGHTNWRCKLLVSDGVTRGRVARGVMGDDVTKGHDVPSASAETTRISGHTLRVFVFVFVVRNSLIALVELFRVS